MIMYSIYKAETLEQLTNTVHCIHNTTPSNIAIHRKEKFINTLFNIHKCTRHAALFHKFLIIFEAVKDKYVLLYKELIAQLHIYTSAIRILAKVYLPISHMTPLKLKGILNDV